MFYQREIKTAGMLDSIYMTASLGELENQYHAEWN